MNQKKKTEQKKSTAKKRTKAETANAIKLDWRKPIVDDIEKALKVSHVKNPKTDEFAINYPDWLLKGKAREEAVNDKILWKMMKERWNGLYGFSISFSLCFEITRRVSGGSRSELIGIGEVRKTKRPCKTAVNLMKTDMESCAASDKELEKAGIKKPKRDIYKDDPCYGCKFAKENREPNMGPFDRRFHCEGISRFTNQIGEAAGFVGEAVSSKDERTRIKFLLQAQRALLYAAMIIGERVENGRLECVQTSGKPSCFIGEELGEYLQSSSKDVRRV